MPFSKCCRTETQVTRRARVALVRAELMRNGQPKTSASAQDHWSAMSRERRRLAGCCLATTNWMAGNGELAKLSHHSSE
jgi:hypothetical protein